jgi:deoxyribonuclease V
MIVAVDVAYAESIAFAAGVWFEEWTDATAAHEHVLRIDEVEPYVPGEFYRRELPCIVAVLEAAPSRPDAIVIDGYVWLDDRRPGLGARLYEAIGGDVAVIGVAKTKFGDASAAAPLVRGASATPLFITAAGIGLEDAVAHIRAMHGPHRMPTLLRRADQLCRAAQRLHKPPR